MTESAKGISVGRDDGRVFVRVVGRGTFQNSQPLRSFAQSMMEQGCSLFVVDLSGCSGMDSTFLGVLAGIGLRLRRSGSGGQVQLLHVSCHNLEVLETMGLDRLFSMQQGVGNVDAAPMELLPLPGTTLGGMDRETLANVVWEAHQTLAQVDDRNASLFQGVNDVLCARRQQHQP